MLLLAGSGVLEPDLRHPLRQTSLLSDALEVLSVWIAVDAEVGMKDPQLFFRERSPHSLRLLLMRTSSVFAI